jgi:polyisoprenoid-binding protein YceI
MNKIKNYIIGTLAVFVVVSVILYLPDRSTAQEALTGKSIAGIRFDYPIEAAVEKGVVRFIADKLTGSFTGETSGVRGTGFKDGPDQAPRGRIIIDAASLDTGIDMRNETMREDHLETHKYPEIIFDLTDVLEVEPGKFRVIGNLTLHGVTKQVGIPVSAVDEDGKLVVRGAVELNMTDYGIKPPVLALLFKVAEEVKISFEIMLRQVKKPKPEPEAAPAPELEDIPEPEVIPESESVSDPSE